MKFQYGKRSVNSKFMIPRSPWASRTKWGGSSLSRLWKFDRFVALEVDWLRSRTYGGTSTWNYYFISRCMQLSFQRWSISTVFILNFTFIPLQYLYFWIKKIFSVDKSKYTVWGFNLQSSYKNTIMVYHIRSLIYCVNSLR